METEFKTLKYENGSQVEENFKIQSSNEGVENKNGKKSSKSRSVTPQTELNLKKEKKINRKNSEKVANVDNDDKNKPEINVNDGKISANEEKINVNDEKINANDEKIKANDEKIIIEQSENVEADKNEEELFSLKLNDDEPEPELQFDDNSDSSFQTDSPIASRCATRRSQIKSVSIPKTPKSLLFDQNKDLENGNDKLLPKEQKISNTTTTTTSVGSPENILSDNDSVVTTESNISSKAVLGSDSACLNFNEDEMEHTSLFINTSKDRSVTETLRCLSPRRPINARAGDIRKSTLRNNHFKSDFNDYYIERITGVKRKGRSETPEDVKRFKGDSSNIFTYLASPLANLKQRFWNGLPSSTPKLTAFKNKDISIEDGAKICIDEHVDGDRKNWCSLM